MSHLSWTERLIDVFLGPNGAWKFSSQFMSHLGFRRRTSSRSYQPLTEETSVAHLHVLSLVPALAIGCAWGLLRPRLWPPWGQLLQSYSVFFPTPPAMANTYLPFPALWSWCFHYWVLRYLVSWCIWCSCPQPLCQACWLSPACLSGCRSPRELWRDHSQSPFLEVSTSRLVGLSHTIHRLLFERYFPPSCAFPCNFGC